MSTYANVLISDRDFCVDSDGGDKQGIRDMVRDYVNNIKGKVKPDYLVTAVLDAITADGARDYYAPFHNDFCEFPSYKWKIEIGKRGGVKITGGKVKLSSR